MRGLIKSFFICTFLMSLCSKAFCADSWTWSYEKVFTKKQMRKNIFCKEFVFSKKNIENFSQLIFSWNAIKPLRGHFTFYVKTRNTRSKKWSKWHKMIDWGAKIQKSYFSRDDQTKYVYVRLETGLGSLSDAFAIKAKCNNFANRDCVNLSLLKSMCVSVSDFNKFKPERINKNLLNLKSVHIKRVPKISQRVLDHPDTSKICSPASCSMLASYFNKKNIDAALFANNVFDNGLGAYGSWPFNAAQLYGQCGGKMLFYVRRLNSFADLHAKLMKKIPVVVSVRGKLLGAPKSYNGGHFIVVIGWDAKKREVICHDPAFYANESTFVKYKLDTFLNGWDKSRRLAYVADFIDKNKSKNKNKNW